jgi:hypothetical protein
MFNNKSKIKPVLGSTIDFNHPLSQGLVGCWLFNEQAGNKIYDLAKDNHGILTNGPIWNSASDGYLQFDGTNDYVDLGTSIQNYSVFTTSIWINFNFFDASHRSPLGDDTQLYLYHLLFWSGSIWVAFSTSPTWTSAGVNHGPISINTWYNFVVTKDSNNNIVFYKNGTSLGSSNTTGATNLNKIGKGYVYDNAKISNVSFYNRALSAEEVLSLYEQPYQFINSPAALNYYSYSQNRSLAAPSITSQELLPILSTFNPSIKYKNISGLTKYAKDIEFNQNTEYTKYSVISKPSNVNITNFGTAGSTTYSYRIKALDETTESIATNASITTTGNSVLSSTNFNRIKWDWVDGAIGYKIFGRINGSEQLIITTVYNHFDDDGSITPSGILNTSSLGGYDYKKVSLGPYYSLYTGNNKEDNYIKLREFDMARPMYDSAYQIQNVYCYFMDVTQWSDDITYIVLDRPSTSNPRRFALYKHFKSTGVMTFVGDIGISGSYGILNLKISLTRYSNGTVSATGTTVTGTNTAWKTSNFSKNSRIGFGTTEPHLVEKWYYITDLPSDTSLTLSQTVAENIPNNTLYVIEELRIVFHTTTNLYLVKGVTENDFSIGKTYLSTLTDPIGANIYNISNPAILGTIFAMPLKPMDDYNTQYVYCVYYIGTSNIIGIKKYNIRKDLTIATQTLQGFVKYEFSGYFADNINFINSNVPVYGGNFNIINLSLNLPAWTYHYYGYINITTPGSYTFYLRSDDASYFWIGANAESGFTTTNAFLSEPGYHGAYEVSASITLSAGPIFLRLICGDAGGGGGIYLEYSGPGITRTFDFSLLGVNSTVTTFVDPLVLTCGGTIPIVNRDRSAMNGVYCVPKHGIYKDTPVILFTSTNGVTVIKDSDIYANNIELFTHSYPLLIMIPNIDVLLFQSRQYQYNISYDELLDRVIYPPSGNWLLKGYISTLGNIDKFIDTNMFSFSGIGNPLSKPNDVVDAIQDAEFLVRSINGWSYFIRPDSIRYRNTIFALPHVAHWTFSDKFKNYCISSMITLDKNTILRRIHCNTNVLYGDNANSISAEPIRCYVRNNGIEDDTGKWTLIDSTGNIEHIQNTGKLQVRFESSLFLHYAKTKKIYGFSVEYDNKETISKGFSWNLSDSNTTNAIVGFVQNELYKANPTFTIKYYNKSNNKLYLIQNADRSSTGDFEYYASGWQKGYGPNQVGLRRRFVPTSALQKNIEYEVELEVK